MSRPAQRWLALPVLLGLYLTAHGYHSRDGDQAYRLPLLLHQQDSRLFADDPFVVALDTFNPHAGYLALLDLSSRPFGLSSALFGLFLASFLFSVLAIDRLARSAWPDAGKGVGIVAIVLFLLAQAGNIGTNHLFEATLLDRLLALSIGWLAIAAWVSDPLKGRWISPPLLGISAWIHPSMGLQLALLLGGSWILELVLPLVACRVGMSHLLCRVGMAHLLCRVGMAHLLSRAANGGHSHILGLDPAYRAGKRSSRCSGSLFVSRRRSETSPGRAIGFSRGFRPRISGSSRRMSRVPST